MLHRPECRRPNLTVGCDCDLIARVEGRVRDEDVAAVRGLPWKPAVWIGPADCDNSCEDGPCLCSGDDTEREVAWMTGREDCMAAIDALRGAE